MRTRRAGFAGLLRWLSLVACLAAAPGLAAAQDDGPAEPEDAEDGTEPAESTEPAEASEGSASESAEPYPAAPEVASSRALEARLEQVLRLEEAEQDVEALEELEEFVDSGELRSIRDPQIVGHFGRAAGGLDAPGTQYGWYYAAIPSLAVGVLGAAVTFVAFALESLGRVDDFDAYAGLWATEASLVAIGLTFVFVGLGTTTLNGDIRAFQERQQTVERAIREHRRAMVIEERLGMR